PPCSPLFPYTTLFRSGVAVRRQPRRRFDEAGEHRGLADRHLLRRLAEIALCRGLDAIGAGTEIDAVQIQFQDLALGILALQPQRSEEHTSELQSRSDL